MRDYTRLDDERFRKELTQYALYHADKGGDLCFSAAVRLGEYMTKLNELKEEMENDGLDTD